MSTFTLQGNLKVPDSGHIGSATQSEAITIDSSGNVGIGKNPECKLDVEGGAIVARFKNTEDTTDRCTLIFETDEREWEIGARGSGTDSDNTFYIHHTNPTSGTGGYVMRIDENRNIGIGTNSPECPLHINRNTTINVSARYFSYIYAAQGESWENISSVDRNICLRTTGGMILTPELLVDSDDRLKTNEQPIANSIDSIMKITPQIYLKSMKLDTVFQAELDTYNQTKNTYETRQTELLNIETRTSEEESELQSINSNLANLEEPTNNQYWEAGLVVQDVFYDAPELRYLLIPGNNSGEISEEDPRGTDSQNDPDYSMWGDTPSNINYNGFIAYLIKAVQELKTTIDSQQATIDSQQATLTDLLARVAALENP